MLRVFKYEKLNYSHRILNIPKIKLQIFFFFFNLNFFFFFNYLFEKKKLVREEKVVHAPTRTMSVNLFGLSKECFHGDPMHMAVYNDDVTEMKRLLSSGADPNVPDDVGNILLHVAVSHKFSDAAHLLVESAVTDCDHQNNLGKSALHLAIESGLYLIATHLIESGASVNLRDHCDLLAVDYSFSMRQPVPIDKQFTDFFIHHVALFTNIKLKSNRNVAMILAYWDRPNVLDKIIETDASIVIHQDTHTRRHYTIVFLRILP